MEKWENWIMREKIAIHFKFYDNNMNNIHTLTCLYLMILNDADDARYNSKKV